jgi:hypothetical protein
MFRLVVGCAGQKDGLTDDAPSRPVPPIGRTPPCTSCRKSAGREYKADARCGLKAAENVYRRIGGEFDMLVVM